MSSARASPDRRATSSSGTPAPSATRVAMAPPASESTSAMPSAVWRASATTAAWLSVSTTTRWRSASVAIQATCSTELVSYRGTGIAPAAQHAKSSRVHSQRVRLMIPTWSPGWTPCAIMPLATAVTSSDTSRAVSTRHVPSSRLTSIMGWSPDRSTRCASRLERFSSGAVGAIDAVACSSMLAPSTTGRGARGRTGCDDDSRGFRTRLHRHGIGTLRDGDPPPWVAA